MKNWFDIDNSGWKRMNAGRPPYELVKELIQNILDENFQVAIIKYYYKSEQFILSIEDDIDGGIKDSSLITTVFMTGKSDSYLKRGRKGRGLKEFLSVCESAIVETVGNTVEFCADGSRKEFLNNRTIGTKISCVIKTEGWDRKAISQITKFLNKIIVYGNGGILVNGNEIKLRKSIYEIENCHLMTQIIEDDIQKDIYMNTTISLYEKMDSKGWLYEMGIPVVETDIPFDVDIHQRIPLNDNRNEIACYYLKEVKTYIVRKMLHSLEKKDMLTWASDGMQSYRFDLTEQRFIATKIIGTDITDVVIKTDNKLMNDKARQNGFSLFDMDSLGYNFQEMIKEVLVDAKDLIENIERDCIPVDVEPTPEELNFIKEHKKLVKEAIGLDIDIKIVEKKEDLVTGNTVEAFYRKGNKSVLSYNRLGMSPKTFAKPYCEKALSLLGHELGHEDYDEHDFGFINSVTMYMARIIVHLMKEKKVKKEKGSTLKNDIKVILEANDLNYVSLNEIYEAKNAVTVNEKAGIRGILNRECLNNGIFERHISGAKYRLKVV
jgi:hypothetical protein